MAQSLPQSVDTVIIGNGPSALILSYILHGHIPYYVGGHTDALLDSKLSKSPALLNLTPDLYAHFLSSLRYSTQALPINTLLDTLIRQNADTEINPQSCIEWRYEPDKVISHVAIGEGLAGGQWSARSGSAVDDIGTLSYAEMLALPGYSFSEHRTKMGHEGPCDFVRPTRTEVAGYFNAYPDAVGISDAIYTSTHVDDISRTTNGFLIGSHGIRCKHLVLASGIFGVNIPPPPLLSPLCALDSESEPLLVVGSGFSAADVIISAPSNRKIIHLFKWAPGLRPSPLKGCHRTAYPEYATIYRQMKLAASASTNKTAGKRPLFRRKSSAFPSSRDWASIYEGLPNAEILNVAVDNPSGPATVTIRLSSGATVTRIVGGLKYMVGRRGSLSYLSNSLLAEVMGSDTPVLTSLSSSTLISGRTLRPKAELSLEVASNVFIIGSLAGDSLIRHAFGGCVYAAGRILGNIPSSYSSSGSNSESQSLSQTQSFSSPASTPGCSTPVSRSGSDGVDTPSQAQSVTGSPVIQANAHRDLHLDRRKLLACNRALQVAEEENRVWEESGWWGGGLGVAAAKREEV